MHVPQVRAAGEPETFHLEFEDGRGLTAEALLLPSLLQVMGVERLKDLAGIEVEVTSEPLPGFAKLQDSVYVFRTAKLYR